jgi:mycoredoxin
VTPAAGAPGAVRVYWRPGCPYCAMLRLGLRGAQVPAEWINIWEDREAAALVSAITGGDETVPTVVVGSRAMVNPSARQVAAAARGGRPGAAAAGTLTPSRLARVAGFLAGQWPRLGARR